MNIPPRKFPKHNKIPVDHSDRIGYVHSTAHSNDTGNNGNKKNPIKPIETAKGKYSFGRRMITKYIIDPDEPINKHFNIL